ncbi:MAG: hypothetical protein JWQ75_13 [Pseudarthrobacter sp.]|nr:hypothetical protein [Pseudarthrobacter sp.]
MRRTDRGSLDANSQDTQRLRAVGVLMESRCGCTELVIDWIEVAELAFLAL